MTALPSDRDSNREQKHMATSNAMMTRPYYAASLSSSTSDPFATNPGRKAVGLILAGAPAAVLTFVPRLLDWLLQTNPVIAGIVGIFMALSIATWAGLVFGIIILFICAIEGLVTLIHRFLTRHLTPVDRLAVSERVRCRVR